jgi:hypothetical protein
LAKQHRKTGVPQPDKDSASISFSPRSISRPEGSLLQKSEPARVDLGAPCGPKPALDPLALKSLQNTPRKTDSVERVDRKDFREAVAGSITTSSISRSGDKQINGSATLNTNLKASKPTNLKPANVTSTSAKSAATGSFSGTNELSNQSRLQDSQRAQQVRKGQSSEEITPSDCEPENSDSHDGIRYYEFFKIDNMFLG